LPTFPAARFTYDLLMAAVAVAVLLVVFEERWERRLAVVLALLAIALTVALYTVPAALTTAAVVAYHLSATLFLGFAVVVIVRDLFRRDAIRFDELIGAFAGYLLLGVVWAISTSSSRCSRRVRSACSRRSAGSSTTGTCAARFSTTSASPPWRASATTT
jgi:hypothetical protein